MDEWGHVEYDLGEPDAHQRAALRNAAPSVSSGTDRRKRKRMRQWQPPSVPSPDASQQRNAFDLKDAADAEEECDEQLMQLVRERGLCNIRI